MTKTTKTSKAKRFVGEVVMLDRDCDLGWLNERAVVTVLDGKYMTLCFVDRAASCREVNTGADYRFLQTAP
jgi:hypothetical protein